MEHAKIDALVNKMNVDTATGPGLGVVVDENKLDALRQQ